MKDAVINARIESTLKVEVELILKDLGLSSTQAINLFYQQVKLQNGIPFELKLPASMVNSKVTNLRNVEDESLYESSKLSHVSRHEVKYELEEMKKFIIDIEKLNLSKYLTNIFYDSKCSICNIEFDEKIITFEIREIIKSIGHNHLSQFSFNGDGNIFHGAELQG